MSLPPKYNLLAQHSNNHYIETGIWRGDSLQFAREAGFKNIVGIELFQENIDFCRSRFYLEQYPDVLRLVKGDSAYSLWNVIKDIDEPITFFLDSHSQLFEDEPKTENPFPLLKELEQIGRHPIKIHTIIIDDYLYLTHPKVTGWGNDEIEKALWKINPEYKISYVANPVVGNLLIAEP